MIAVKLEPGAMKPVKAHKKDAGFDLFAYNDVEVLPNTRALISVGISVAIPIGYYGRIAPRSGLSVKGIDIGAGVIDCSYRGIVKVCFINNSDKSYMVGKGSKIAQLIIEKIHPVDYLLEVDDLDETDRGSGGFGSTGV